MAKTLKMGYDNAKIVKNNFYDTQDDLEGKKKGFPRSADGGGRTKYIAGMTVKVAEDAGDIAIYSKLGGDRTANAMDKMKGMDEGVAQTFREMEKKIS